MTEFKKYQFANGSKHPAMMDYSWGVAFEIEGGYTLVISPQNLTIIDDKGNKMNLSSEMVVFIQDYIKMQEYLSTCEAVGIGVDKAGKAGWVPGQGGFTQTIADHLQKLGVLNPGWKDRGENK